MNKISPLLFVAVIALSAISCKRVVKNDKNLAIVSILPQKEIVGKIAGEKFDIKALVPTNNSPETFELTPIQIKELSAAKVYFTLGLLEFEKSYIKDALSGNTATIICNLSESSNLLSEITTCNDSNHNHGGIDPHVWLSVVEVKSHAKAILNCLLSIDSANRDYYQQNYLNFLAELDSLNLAIDKKLSGKTNKTFLIYHPSLGYFARDYGFNQISIEQEGKEPTPKVIKDIYNLVSKKQVKKLIISSELDKNIINSIVNKTGVSIVIFNPLNPNWKDNMMLICNLLAD